MAVIKNRIHMPRTASALLTDKALTASDTTRLRRFERAHMVRIGIATPGDMRARTIAIARGELKSSPDDPKIWFPSIEALGKALSGKNLELLAEIRRAPPETLQALADRTGRKLSNLSRTLRTMELYGLVRLEKAGRRVLPVVDYDEVDIRVPLPTVA